LETALAGIQEDKASVFFFEKKNQKTFASCSGGLSAAHAKQNSLAFGKAGSASLRKRRLFFFIRAVSVTQAG